MVAKTVSWSASALRDPGVVAEHRALQDPVGGDVGEVGAGVEARVEVDVAVLAVAQVGVHRGDVGRRAGPAGSRRAASASSTRVLLIVGGDADLPVEPVAVVALRLVAVVVVVQPAQAVDAPGAARRCCRAGPTRSAGGAGGQRDLVQVLEGRWSGWRRWCRARTPWNSSPGPAASIAVEPGPARRVDGRELGGDLGAGVGLGGAGEDRDGVARAARRGRRSRRRRRPAPAASARARSGCATASRARGGDHRQQGTARNLHGDAPGFTWKALAAFKQPGLPLSMTPFIAGSAHHRGSAREAAGLRDGRRCRRRHPRPGRGHMGCGAAMPSRSRPSASVRAVRSHSASRLLRVGSSARSTGQFS